MARRKQRDSNLEDDFREIEQMSKFIKQEKSKNLIFKIKAKFKNQKQKLMYDTILENRITLIQGSAGTGKAQPMFCNILTTNGWVKMGDIKIGDVIITPDNKQSIINGIFPQGEKDIYKITFSDNSETYCCDEHLWAVKNEAQRNKYKKINNKKIKEELPYSILQLKDIKNNLYIRKGRKNYNIPISNAIDFKKEEYIIDPYLMGFLLGDGTFVNHVGYSTSDEELHLKVKEIISNTNCQSKYYSNYDYSIIGFKQKNYILDEIKDLGLFNKKSNEKFIPKKYLFSTIEDRKKLLYGLMDTDGTIDKRNSVISYCTISKQLKDDIIELVNSLGGIAKVTTKIPNFTYKGVKKEGQLCYIININLDFNPFSLERKKSLFKEKLKYKASRFIKSIEYYGKELAQCISIEDKNHLYITDNYIVTHNTFIALMTALECLKNKKIGQIILTKPIVEVSKSIGLLPGEIGDKTHAYFIHFYDNLNKLIGSEQSSYLRDNGFIIESILNFMRGLTFDNLDENGKSLGAIVILDEAQNTNVHEMKTFISRMGEDCKLIIMGDVDQSDLRLPFNDKNGLKDAIDRFQDMENVGYVEFTDDDIVRDPFLIEIMKRYRK